MLNLHHSFIKLVLVVVVVVLLRCFDYEFRLFLPLLLLLHHFVIVLFRVYLFASCNAMPSVLALQIPASLFWVSVFLSLSLPLFTINRVNVVYSLYACVCVRGAGSCTWQSTCVKYWLHSFQTTQRSKLNTRISCFLFTCACACVHDLCLRECVRSVEHGISSYEWWWW